MTLPQIDLRPFRDLCCSPSLPRKMTGILQMWLCQHFLNPNNIKTPGIQQRVWNPDPELSKIQILPLEDWRPNNTEQRPSILIKRQGLKFVRYGIDNRLMGSGALSSHRRVYQAGLQGSHTVFCIAGEAGEAEALSTEVAFELMRFAPVVREALGLLRVEFVDLDVLSKLEEATENYVVPANISYAFLTQWELLSLDDPKITSIRSIISQ